METETTCEVTRHVLISSATQRSCRFDRYDSLVDLWRESSDSDFFCANSNSKYAYYGHTHTGNTVWRLTPIPYAIPYILTYKVMAVVPRCSGRRADYEVPKKVLSFNE